MPVSGARKHVVGVEPQLQGVLAKTLGKHSWPRAMLGRCKARLLRDAKMQALGLTLRDEPGKGEGLYYDGKEGLSRGQELDNLIDHTYPIKREELTALEQQGSDLANYGRTRSRCRTRNRDGCSTSVTARRTGCAY